MLAPISAPVEPPPVSVEVDLGVAGVVFMIDAHGAPTPNAFSLSPDDRYAHSLTEAELAQGAKYLNNSSELDELLDCNADERLRAAECLGRWIADNAVGGFRWHVSGDIVSRDYAVFIRDVCRASHPVRHWIYTRRTDELILQVLSADNLAVNLSADRDNYKAMRVLAASFPRVRLTYLTIGETIPADLPEGSVVFLPPLLHGRDGPWWRTATTGQRAMVCPVDAQGGESAEVRCGPCSRCLLPRTVRHPLYLTTLDVAQRAAEERKKEREARSAKIAAAHEVHLKETRGRFFMLAEIGPAKDEPERKRTARIQRGLGRTAKEISFAIETQVLNSAPCYWMRAPMREVLFTPKPLRKKKQRHAAGLRTRVQVVPPSFASDLDGFVMGVFVPELAKCPGELLGVTISSPSPREVWVDVTSLVCDVEATARVNMITGVVISKSARLLGDITYARDNAIASAGLDLECSKSGASPRLARLS